MGTFRNLKIFGKTATPLSPAHPSQATGVTFEVLDDDHKVDFSRIERVV